MLAGGWSGALRAREIALEEGRPHERLTRRVRRSHSVVVALVSTSAVDDGRAECRAGAVAKGISRSLTSAGFRRPTQPSIVASRRVGRSGAWRPGGSEIARLTQIFPDSVRDYTKSHHGQTPGSDPAR